MSNPSSGHEIHRKTSQPVSAFVMLAGDGGESGALVLLGCCGDCAKTLLAMWQTGGNSPEHPGAAEVESVKMRKLGIARIGRNHRLHPASIFCPRNLRQESLQPVGEVAAGQNAPHHVSFGEAR